MNCSFGSALARLIDAEDITFTAYAKKAGISLNTLNGYIAGKTTPSIKTAIKMFNALGYRLILVKDDITDDDI